MAGIVAGDQGLPSNSWLVLGGVVVSPSLLMHGEDAEEIAGRRARLFDVRRGRRCVSYELSSLVVGDKARLLGSRSRRTHWVAIGVGLMSSIMIDRHGRLLWHLHPADGGRVALVLRRHLRWGPSY
jgi:hypothetical protein